MKFSILIPAYKNQYLQECINSILAQTFENWELIILNDASPYDVDGIVATFSDPRIRYYKNELNVGAVNVVDNWNKCLEYATGDYIICMGDDDRLLPNCLEAYCNLIEKYPGLGVYHAWTELIDENSEFLDVTASRPEYESVYSLIWHRMDNRHKQYIGDFLFNRELLLNNGGFYKLPLAWGSDDISATIAAIPNGIANTQIVTFQYRKNRFTLSSTGSIEVKVDALMKQRAWYIEFLSKEPVNLQDAKFRKRLLEICPSYLEKQVASKISMDVDNNIFHIIKWMKKKRKYGYSNRIFIYVLKSYIKNMLM